MTLLNRVPNQKATTLSDRSRPAMGTKPSEELTIHVSSCQNHPSPMPKTLKKKVRKNAPSLIHLFEKTVEGKGGDDSTKANWLGQNEVEVKGLSKMTLHKFVLEAEKLGKTVTYTQTVTVKVSD